MARGKKSKTGGKARHAGKRGNPKGKRSSLGGFIRSSDEADSETGFHSPSRTMSELAARANRDNRTLTTGPSLRHQFITFVSSEGEQQSSDKSRKDRYKSSDDPSTDRLVQQTQLPRHHGEHQSSLPADSLESARDNTINKSALPSDPDEEVIVFKGRMQTALPPDEQPRRLPQQRSIKDTEPAESAEWDDSPENWVDRVAKRQKMRQASGRDRKAELHHGSTRTSRTPHVYANSVEKELSSLLRDTEIVASRAMALNTDPKEHDASAGYPTQWQQAGNRRDSSRNHPRKPRRNRKVAHDSEDWEGDSDAEAVLQDYIENMKVFGLPKTAFKHDQPSGDWANSDLEDLDDLSTSEEVLEEVAHILSKRTRPSGLQYLVVWQGQSMDEAKWILGSSLNMPGAAEMIASFEEDTRLQGVIGQEDSDDSSEESSGGIDEEEAFRRRVERMSDEQIARLLAKQEELGLPADELLLLDGNIDDDNDDDDDIADGWNSTDDMEEAAVVSRQRGRNKGSQDRRNRHKNDPDLAMEDFGGYGGFDVLDWERPSLQKKGRARGQLGSSAEADSGLLQLLQDQWANDRRKKKAQKQEREELRSQGLLGKKHKKHTKPDLQNLFAGGMSTTDIRYEFEDFLDNDDEQLVFPAMDKRERKLIHEFANRFNLKSKSSGSGRNRFPILYKTKRTIPFDEDLFDRAEASMEKRFFGGSSRKAKTKATRPSRAGGGLGNSFNYQDGEKVGAGASELTAENRGRAMLEKMGWSHGTALGALDNKGILMPVDHFVKKTRAGLGGN